MQLRWLAFVSRTIAPAEGRLLKSRYSPATTMSVVLRRKTLHGQAAQGQYHAAHCIKNKPFVERGQGQWKLCRGKSAPEHGHCEVAQRCHA